jgi:hypothetical protein
MLLEAPLAVPEGLSTPFVGDYYWNAPRPYFDQGARGICVGASWNHWLTTSPLYTRSGPDPETIYKEAQLIDEWPGEEPAYEGTSVRAGAKVLQAKGHIANYFWATTLAEIIECLKTRGPVVVGTEWTASMMRPSPGEIVEVSGRVLGGHAYLLIGLSENYQVFRALNSWGEWTPSGGFWLRFADFERLLHRQGEACIATEQSIL